LLAEGSVSKPKRNYARNETMAILGDARMSKGNLVKVTTYITSTDFVPLYRELRDLKLIGL